MLKEYWWEMLVLSVTLGLVLCFNNFAEQQSPQREPTHAVGYPETLGLTYVHEQDWPPMRRLMDVPYGCTEAGEATARAGKTGRRTMAEWDGFEYCRTMVVEGAAGSTYTKWEYSAPRSGKTLILNWTTRAPNCSNYSGEEMHTCEAEQAAFDMDTIAEQMIRADIDGEDAPPIVAVVDHPRIAGMMFLAIVAGILAWRRRKR